jgi:hypothetical protein
MTMLAPFQPTPGGGQTVTTGASAAHAVNADDRQVVVTNLDAAEVAYVRVAPTGPATAADFPVLPGKQVCLTKGAGAAAIYSFSAGTPDLHIATGNGWLNG